MTSPVSPLGPQTCEKPMRGLYGAQTVCARPAGHVGKCDPIWREDDWPSASPVSPLATLRELATGIVCQATDLPGASRIDREEMRARAREILAVLDSLDSTITLSREEAREMSRCLYVADLCAMGTDRLRFEHGRLGAAYHLLAARIEESK